MHQGNTVHFYDMHVKISFKIIQVMISAVIFQNIFRKCKINNSKEKNVLKLNRPIDF